MRWITVISAFYYLRIIKIMYFDAPVEEGLDMVDDGRLNFALMVSALAVICFIAMPGPLLSSAEAGAKILFP